MGRIILNMEVGVLVPLLIVFKKYFDDKYPCTTDDNDGSDMDSEDVVLYQTYNYILSSYEKCKSIAEEEYKTMLKKVSESLQTT